MNLIASIESRHFNFECLEVNKQYLNEEKENCHFFCWW